MFVLSLVNRNGTGSYGYHQRINDPTPNVLDLEYGKFKMRLFDECQKYERCGTAAIPMHKVAFEIFYTTALMFAESSGTLVVQDRATDEVGVFEYHNDCYVRSTKRDTLVASMLNSFAGARRSLMCNLQSTVCEMFAPVADTMANALVQANAAVPRGHPQQGGMSLVLWVTLAAVVAYMQLSVVPKMSSEVATVKNDNAQITPALASIVDSMKEFQKNMKELRSETREIRTTQLEHNDRLLYLEERVGLRNKQGQLAIGGSETIQGFDFVQWGVYAIGAMVALFFIVVLWNTLVMWAQGGHARIE